MPAGPAILLLKAPGAKDNSENFGFLLIDFYLAVHQVPLLHWCFPARLWVRIWFTYDGSLLPGWQCEGEVEKRGEAVAWRGLLHLLLLPSLEVGSLFGEGEVQPGIKNVFLMDIKVETHYSWRGTSSICHRVNSTSPVLRNGSIYCILWMANMTKTQPPLFLNDKKIKWLLKINFETTFRKLTIRIQFASSRWWRAMPKSSIPVHACKILK